MLLKDKVSIVTGGGSGIGRATAIKFAREGAKVVVADFNDEQGRQVADEIAWEGGQATFVCVDVSDFTQVERLVDSAVEIFDDLHIMFNNAGIGASAPLLEHTPEMYDRVVKVNQYGVFYGILAAGRKMRDRRTRGVIINTASVFAMMGSPGVIGYHASKGAVKMMTQAAGLELGPFGIRVVGVAPGVVNTPIIQGYKDAGCFIEMSKRHMRGRIMEPEEIANAVALLASDEASVINGSLVMLDDGYAEFK